LPRKTNYGFERREPEKSKATGKAEKVQAKADKKLAELDAPKAPETDES
jgi:hypothetical protein